MLKLKKITKFFPGNHRAILNEIDLELSPGEFCVIIGSNGSGKSTLMKTIAGEYEIENGAIETCGKVIAYVNQNINKGTIPEMSLLENMALSNMHGKKSSFSFFSKKKNSIVNKVKTLGIDLENFIDKPLGSLSGGQRQMIATLMAIESKPDLLLLDEHTSALDPRMQKLLMDFTAQAIAKHKITTMMITHKLDDAINYGDRLIMLHEGNIVLNLNTANKNLVNIETLLKLFHQHDDLITDVSK